MESRIRWQVAIALLFACSLHAQDFSIGTGATLQSGFGNLSFGPSIIMDGTIARNETILTATFAPFAEHVALGRGYAYNESLRDTVWFGKIGGTGQVDVSGYSVSNNSTCSRYASERIPVRIFYPCKTTVQKHNNYAFAGLAFRSKFIGNDATYYFDYFREFQNGISHDGIETNRIQGGSIKYDITSGKIRVVQNLLVGTGLEQGNPVCDGTYNRHVTCPRSRYLSFGVSTSIFYRW